jgi:23S rRNA (uridine2552-2'-O)-methyltransferase
VGRRRSDHWTKKAKEQGYAARSVFKLEELDRRFSLLSRSNRILDLGCAPGSWSAYAKKKRPGASLVGIDLKPVPTYPGHFILGSILELEQGEFLSALGGAPDLVLSDMAPNTMGNRFTDHIRQLELASCALDVALELLVSGGDFVVKVFDGEDAPAFMERLRSHFGKVHRAKPKSTRGQSVEFFAVAKGLSRS